VARVDFAWPGHRVALEYEGAWHTTRVAADRRRIEALQAAGWRVLFVTAADLHSTAALIARIAGALIE
jgi:very-short-patch-repair endonuclease